MSKGKDVSSMFPYVVKNVVAKDIEVKRLVYMYLVHYAEREPDAALLSIATFQKELKNSNQLVRAQSLRVMSSIRVPIIGGVISIAIKQCVSDPSPYVRKTAAHAISKVFNLDPTQREGLIECVGSLLCDQSTLVLGSAVAAFNEVCPNNFELIHKNFRKFCNLLADIDEWGQIAMLTMFTRYGRTQFLNPDPDEEERKQRRLKLTAAKKANASGSDSTDSDSEGD